MFEIYENYRKFEKKIIFSKFEDYRKKRVIKKMSKFSENFRKLSEVLY